MSVAPLKGRFAAATRKLLVIGLGGATSLALAAYFGYYQRRVAMFNEYNKSLTDKNQKDLEERMELTGGFYPQDKLYAEVMERFKPLQDSLETLKKTDAIGKLINEDYQKWTAYVCASTFFTEEVPEERRKKFEDITREAYYAGLAYNELKQLGN